MIPEANIDKAIERLITRTQATNEFFLEKMGNAVKEIGTLTPSQARQLSQMLKYGDSYDEITEELARLSDKNVEDIYDIYDEVAKSDYAFAKQFYDYRGIEQVPFLENYALQNQLNAIKMMTASTYINLANANTLGYGMIDETTGEVTYRNVQDTYYDLIDDAIMSVAQGKESFNSAMYRQLKTIGEGGLRVIYPSTYETTNENGEIITKNRSMRLDSAIRMNMKQGLTSMHNELQNQFGQEFGADGVEISVHMNPAPDHAPYQGKQFSNKEYEELQASLDRPIGMYNCYHYNFAIVLGVSTPEYSQEELDRINEENEEGFEYNGKHYTNYEGTQMQRQLERKVREQKDTQILAKASGNNALIKESQDNIKALTDEYKKFSAESGLPTKMQRMRVSGYQRTKVEIPSQPKEYKRYDNNENEFIKNNSNVGIQKYMRESREKYPHEGWEQGIKDIDNQIKGKLNENIITYRTTEIPVEQLKIGEYVDDKTFIPTSITKEKSLAFSHTDKRTATIEIEVDKGTRCLYIGGKTGYSLNENELLFPPDYKIEITDIGKKYDIELPIKNETITLVKGKLIKK